MPTIDGRLQGERTGREGHFFLVRKLTTISVQPSSVSQSEEMRNVPVDHDAARCCQPRKISVQIGEHWPTYQGLSKPDFDRSYHSHRGSCIEIGGTSVFRAKATRTLRNSI